MKLRQFSDRGSAASLLVLLFPGIATRALGDNHSLPFDIRSFLESDNWAVMRFAEDILQQCVLAKIKPPEGTLAHRCLQSGTVDAFNGQWIGDTIFVVVLLAMLPDTKVLIRGVFQNYWDFQDHWNAKKLEYAHNMVPCMIEPRNNTSWLSHPAYPRIPILGWGA